MSRQYHIVLGRPFDLDRFDRDSAANKCPRHAMSVLRHTLGANVHQPGGRPLSLVDRLGAKVLTSNADQVALARELAESLTENDVVFATGEDVGFPLALALRGKKRRPRLVVEVHSPRGRRSQVAIRLLRVANTIDLFLATTPDKVAFVERVTGLPPERFHAMHEVTDTAFFTPGPANPEKVRPIIGACGLEQRDYVTLAEATKDLDVDVRICAASPNASSKRSNFPEVPPANMKAEHYEFPELVQLYRDSDVVAVPLRPNPFQAGQTAVMEAMACERPIVITEQIGMVADFARDSLVNTVPEQDPAAMRKAIEDLLRRPEEAEAQGKRARQRIVESFNTERYVEHLAGVLRAG